LKCIISSLTHPKDLFGDMRTKNNNIDLAKKIRKERKRKENKKKKIEKRPAFSVELLCHTEVFSPLIQLTSYDELTYSSTLSCICHLSDFFCKLIP